MFESIPKDSVPFLSFLNYVDDIAEVNNISPCFYPFRVVDGIPKGYIKDMRF